MAHCINKNTEEYKALLEQSGLNQIVLNAKISIWQDKNGIDNFPSINDINHGINDVLKSGFLSDFNFDVKEYESIKESLGYDNIQMVDLVSKFIAIEKGAGLDKASAYVAYKFLGRDNSKVRSELKFRIYSWEKHDELYNKYKDEIFKEKGFIDNKYKWNNLIKEKIIIDFLSEVILEHAKNPIQFEKTNDRKWTKDDFTFFEKIIRWLRNKFISKEESFEKLRNTAVSLADEIISQEYDILKYDVKEDQIKKYYESTINSDDLAKGIVEFSQSKGIILTGSLALRKTGTVFRTEEENLHDIDFVVPFSKINSIENKKAFNKIVRYQGPDVEFASEMALEAIEEFSWFKEFQEKYPTYRITNGFYGAEHGDFGSFTLTGVIDGEFHAEKGFHEDQNGNKVSHEKGDWVNGTGYVIDHFISLNDKQEEHENYFKLWKEIMIAKLMMSRSKDLTDFKHFIPFVKSKDTFNFYYPDFVFSEKSKKGEITQLQKSDVSMDSYPSLENLNDEKVKDTRIKDSSEKIEDIIETFYGNQDLSTSLIEQFSDRNSNDTVNTTERKIELMKQALNAEVLVDGSLDASGALLPANHPLSLKYGKPVILINPNKLFGDTVFHEFGHLYIDLLGKEDSVLNQAYELLRSTEFYNQIQDKYPELNSEDLDKEVLATAIGIEGDKIFKRDIEALSNWQKIKNYILNKLKSIFNIEPNALEKLASELLTNNVRLSGAESFNSIITQRSKYKIESTETNKQKAVLDLFNTLNKRFTKQEVDGNNVYQDEEGNLFNNSVTKNIKKYQKRYNNPDKGNYEVKFERELFTKDNIELQLNSPRLPLALTKALNDFIKDNIVATSFVKDQEDKNWLDSYTRELNNQVNTNLSEEDLMVRNLANQVNSLDNEDTNTDKLSFTYNLLKHLDAILDRAEEYQQGYNQAPIVGNIIHNSIEDYVNNNTPFPSNINDTDNILLNEIKKIIDIGRAAGSIFVTEQILYSENRQLPGTADLIEITKDGEVRVYDYKTVNSFTGKNKGNTFSKSDQSLYYDKGYIHQLLSYGAILNQYNISLANDPYHIIMAEVKYSNINNEDDSITITEVRNKSLSDSKLISLVNSTKNTIFTEFASASELENINIKPEIQDLNDLVKRINNYISIYKKRTQNITSNLDTRDIDKIQNDLKKQYDVENSVNEYVAKNNQVIIHSYVDNIHNALSLLEEQKEYIGETPSPEFLQSLNYVLQATEALGDIKKLLEDKGEDIELEDKELVLKNINNTLKIIEDNKTYYKNKLQRLSISHLTENSNLMYGLYREKYQLEAKKQGIRDKAKQEEYIETQLKANENLIKVKEINYWTKQYEDGFADIRFLEYLMADPGMNKSQFVQLTKNIMDKSDLAKRNKMLDIMPDINKWYENLSFNKTGDPKKVWDKFIERKKVKNIEDNTTTTKLAGRVIPEFTSKYRELYIRYETAITEHYRVLNKYKKQSATADNLKKIADLNETIKVLKKERQTILKEKIRDIEDFQEQYVHPEFAKLTDKEKEDLRFIHKNLLEADERLYSIPERKLTKELEDGTLIFNLPRDRKSNIEAAYDGGGVINTFKSKFEDLFRPPADSDEEAFTQEEYSNTTKLNTTELDIYGNEVFSVPVYYRNQLEDEDLQSYDIPTLLALNHETTVTFEENKLIEADLFVILESLNSKNNSKILKTDSFINSKIQNSIGKNFQKSDQNLVYQAVKSSIDNRLYKRAYRGVYSRGNYQLIKGAEAISKYASTLVLAGNFMSALSTFSQGTIYRFLEGGVAEHITLNDWQVGTKKAWLDFPNMLADTQRFVPQSKTELLVKKFGLETQAHALVNKFVQDNFIKKQLDQGTLFSVTSMAEGIVTATLMYSLLSNIKVTNSKGEYINQNGEKVSKNEAMSLDEAYNLVDGKLELNPHVTYTSFNVAEKYNDGTNKDTTIAATEISRYIRSIYADLYGQYNQDMKSVLQRNIFGKLAMSLRGWLPRGVNRRWRGITDVVGKDFMSFDELRDENNLDKRFYSQDQKQFQEGHYTTSIRFMRTIFKEMKKNQQGLLNARKNVRATMTDHEIANLKRTQYELGIIVATMALAFLLRAIALNSGGDDKDQEKLYFAAFLSDRINTELMTFISPSSMIDMISNPAASMSVIQRMFDWLWQLAGVAYSKDEGINWNINDVYQTGDKEDENKAVIKSLGLIPFYTKANQLGSIFGLDTNNSIKSSFEFNQSH